MVVILSKLASLDCCKWMILGKDKNWDFSNLDRTSCKTVVMVTASKVSLLSFVMYISGTKCEEHCFHISRDILDTEYFTINF